jgi:hypothetical protein
LSQDDNYRYSFQSLSFRFGQEQAEDLALAVEEMREIREKLWAKEAKEEIIRVKIRKI